MPQLAAIVKIPVRQLRMLRVSLYIQLQPQVVFRVGFAGKLVDSAAAKLGCKLRETEEDLHHRVHVAAGGDTLSQAHSGR